MLFVTTSVEITMQDSHCQDAMLPVSRYELCLLLMGISDKRIVFLARVIDSGTIFGNIGRELIL